MNLMLRAAAPALLAGAIWAQAPATPESLTAWPYYKEIPAREGPTAFTLDRDVLDKSPSGAADLRLYDNNSREIPYSLRVRRDVDTRSLFTGREFNRAVEGTAAVVSCDLGAQPQEHNEVRISSAGDNFRRYADVSGSSDGTQWSTLASQAIIFRFAAGGRTVEQDAVSYPVSRYRYLRVRLERDPQVDHAAPEITSLGVLRTVRSPGLTLRFEGMLQAREPEPVGGRPASVWRIDLGGRIPLQALVLSVGDQTFSRPFQLDIIDDPGTPIGLASGDLRRVAENRAAPVRIDFGEQYARHLKLTVTDDRNPPLTLINVAAFSAARQVVFDAPGGNLRLYYGNPKAIAPHYDKAVQMQPDAGANVTLGTEVPNPQYRPEPKPLSERAPWLVYVVLIGACATLAAILLNLARSAGANAPASS